MADDDVTASDPLQFDTLRLEELTRVVDRREIPGEAEYLRAAGPVTSQYLKVWETCEVRAITSRASIGAVDRPQASRPGEGPKTYFAVPALTAL